MPEGHYWIGRSLEKLGRRTEARRHFERLAATQPRTVDAARPFEVRMEAREGRGEDFYVKALGLLGLGRRAEARTALASALEADPDNVGAVVLRRSLAAAPPAASRPKPRTPVEAPVGRVRRRLGPIGGCFRGHLFKTRPAPGNRSATS